MLLLFKLFLTPLLVGLVSLAGRRWGPTVSGWLVGLPLTSGPVALFLALALGRAFAANAAQGTLTGLISLAAFCLTYSWLSFRVNWVGSLLISWGAFFCVTFVLQYVVIPLLAAFIIVLCCLALTLKLLPNNSNHAISVKPASWDTPLRIVVATAFVLALTGFANLLGSRLSGLLTPFPIYASILAVFIHRVQGAASARQLFRGVITGVFSFAVFFLIIAELVVPLGIVLAFSLATLLALALHGISLYVLRKYAISLFRRDTIR
ncbi:MAG: hypothetical protein NVS9B9_13850 [Ktedonobacteraceae bacterium]